MATISVRRLDENWDYTFGKGKDNYLTGVDAVAQAVKTKLLLFLTEWWEDQNDGLPLWQKILGVPGAGNNKKNVDRLIQARILEVPYVTNVYNISSSYNASTRAYEFSARIDTAFGSLTVTNATQ